MKYKLIIGSPDDIKIIEKIINAASQAGAGIIGDYKRCFVINKIKATWIPTKKSNPNDGKINEITEADCVWIETECDKKDLKKIIKEIKRVHPYEEPGIQVIKLEDI